MFPQDLAVPRATKADHAFLRPIRSQPAHFSCSNASLRIRISESRQGLERLTREADRKLATRASRRRNAVSSPVTAFLIRRGGTVAKRPSPLVTQSFRWPAPLVSFRVRASGGCSAASRTSNPGDVEGSGDTDESLPAPHRGFRVLLPTHRLSERRDHPVPEKTWPTNDSPID